MYPNVALACVVPCQAGVSVLLQPHGPDVAYVLPAVQKIAQMGAERRGKETEGVGERRGCEVLYDGGKCTPLPFSSCPPLPADAVAKPLNDMADFRLLSSPPSPNHLWMSMAVICTCTAVAAAHAQTCLPPHTPLADAALLCHRGPGWLRCPPSSLSSSRRQSLS